MLTDPCSLTVHKGLLIGIQCERDTGFGCTRNPTQWLETIGDVKSSRLNIPEICRNISYVDPNYIDGQSGDLNVGKINICSSHTGTIVSGASADDVTGRSVLIKGTPSG